LPFLWMCAWFTISWQGIFISQSVSACSRAGPILLGDMSQAR
jgi:hypothetical protein